MVILEVQYIILDLEWNGMPVYRTGGYFNEIIEFGAVKLNSKLEQIDTFRAFVKPEVHKKLSGRVKKLTHISNDEVRGAESFAKTYSAFKKWVGKAENCFLSWGTGDILVLLENLKEFGFPENLDIMTYYCDIQTICQLALDIDKSKQPGLSLIAEQLGITCDDMDMHRALDDSLVTVECMRRLWSEELFMKCRARADSEFIRKLTFKTVILCDINNPLITRNMFRQRCPECGTRMRRITEIVAKNKSFTATYHCSKCDADMIGKHQFKLKYEGVVHKCTLRPINTAESEPNQAEAVAAVSAEDNAE